MPNAKKNSPDIGAVLLNTRAMCDLLDCAPATLKRLKRSEFIQGAHYFSLGGNAQIRWNKNLILDYLACGGKTPAHMRAVEKFLSQLPSNNCA